MSISVRLQIHGDVVRVHLFSQETQNLAFVLQDFIFSGVGEMVQQVKASVTKWEVDLGAWPGSSPEGQTGVFSRHK